MNMKKLFFLGLAMILAACQIVEMDSLTKESLDLDSKSFKATIEGHTTKVFVKENRHVLWNSGDSICVFNFSMLNEQYNFTGKDGDAEGDFNRVAASNRGDGMGKVQHTYAIYPYSENTSIGADDIIAVELPSKQLYAEKSFGPGANMMVAVSDDNLLSFKNLGGYLCVRLYGDGTLIKTLTLKGNNGEKIAGAARIKAGIDIEPTVEMSDAATDIVSIECPSSLQISTSPSECTDFWFVLPPTTFSKGFTLTVYDTYNRSFDIVTSNSITVSRNTRLSMAPALVEMGALIPPSNMIYYQTADEQVIRFPINTPFNVDVVSNTYQDGLGIIELAGDLKRISPIAFGNTPITNIFLPDCVERIESGAFAATYLTSFRVPQETKYVTTLAFQNTEISEFTGVHTSSDGKCIILDNTLMAFVNKCDEDYTTPEGCISIFSNAFFKNKYLKHLTISEGVTSIQSDAFEWCEELETISFPNSLEKVGYTPFSKCRSIAGFYGNSKFCTEDHQFFIVPEGYAGHSSPVVVGIAHQQRKEIIIPEGIVAVENYCFIDDFYLESLYLPKTLQYIGGQSFGGDCPNFHAIYGNMTSEDHRCVIMDDSIRMFAGGGIKDYTTPKGVTSLYDSCFRGNNTIETIEISEGVKTVYSNCFRECANLKSVIFPSTVTEIGSNIIEDSPNIEALYCKAIIPPSLRINLIPFYSKMSVCVPDLSFQLYARDPAWNQYFGSRITSHHFDNLDTPDYYMSSDFSEDGKVITLQEASKGNGIDVVFLGDAFSDRQIADGTYKNIMEFVTESFFLEEPFKSFKEFFNIYYVVAVSATEGYENGGQALGTYYQDPGRSMVVKGDEKIIFSYARKAISEDRMDEVLVAVIMNGEVDAGTTTMSRTVNGDFGNGSAIALVPIGSSKQRFAEVLVHEACGHGFAKLVDEYYYAGSTPTTFDISGFTFDHSMGWSMNIDFTNDVDNILWSRFLKDSRYEGLVGIYEGALYEHGAYRPSENSIMRNNKGGFNAPSRQSIWYRINKLAYGSQWQGTYEDFVAYDAINRNSSPTSKRQSNFVEREMRPLPSPIVLEKSWREIISE